MLGSQGIVVSCTAAIFFPTVDYRKSSKLAPGALISNLGENGSGAYLKESLNRGGEGRLFHLLSPNHGQI